MNVAWTTWKKEMMSYLFSPIGYVVAVLLYLFRGVELTSVVQRIVMWGGDRDQFAQTYVLGMTSGFMMVLVPPILTMRCFAEEKRTGSLETLLTAPVRDWEVVLGKWSAAVTFFVLLWVPALVLLLLLGQPTHLAVEIAAGPVLAGFLGVLLVGSLLIAAGCFTSSLTDNQLLASLASILFGIALMAGPGLLAPYLVGSVIAEADAMTAWDRVRSFVMEMLLRPLASQIDVNEHLVHWFSRGLINTGHVAFYVAGTACFLFLTTRSLEARRWR